MKSLKIWMAAFCMITMTLPGLASSANVGVSEDNMYSLYSEALTLFYEQNYKNAVAILEKIEGLYPFSKVAIEGGLISAVANYELGKYDEAYSLADGYIGIYPNSEIIHHAYYVRIVSKYMSIPDLALDHTAAQDVKQLASEFIKMFPQSEHAENVQKITKDVDDHMAAKEFLIGKFYLKKGEYVAAIRRFTMLIEQYPESVYFQESIYRLLEAYVAMGDMESAQRCVEKLENGPWFDAGARYLTKQKKAVGISKNR